MLSFSTDVISVHIKMYGYLHSDLFKMACLAINIHRLGNVPSQWQSYSISKKSVENVYFRSALVSFGWESIIAWKYYPFVSR